MITREPRENVTSVPIAQLNSSPPPCTEKEPLVEFKSVSKRYGSNVILDQLDLTIYRGDALVMIGPSGTGKSTILRLIAGLTAPDEGEIYIKGQLRTGSIEDGQDLMRMALVFQQSALFDSLTVEQNVGFFLYEHSNLSRRRIREIVEETLQMIGLENIGDRYPAELSGGMKKRVSFARALISNPDSLKERPELVLYDEPTAGLDPIASTVLEDLVRKLKQTQKGCGTYVMVSHQESTIRRTADRIVMLYQGRVQWQGSVEEIDTTDNPLVRQFFSGSIDGPIQFT
ncbi:ABC transporter ATP-binding protein [Chroococcus sp. FPU101]|uniref:ABC transporter ATP-binding protein n=1 Tax=Chroococcus sp. FPU101 TaxID=1974212 RepID=UPI001A902C65|nr:ABC transporter ATP-binding protein [Chroococcus sp. FPU101]GFE72005.1 ATP-binding protein of ABC transporter [Chroococcus sp. FPU101]